VLCDRNKTDKSRAEAGNLPYSRTNQQYERGGTLYHHHVEAACIDSPVEADGPPVEAKVRGKAPRLFRDDKAQCDVLHDTLYIFYFSCSYKYPLDAALIPSGRKAVQPISTMAAIERTFLPASI
jgi:hypothetical protein